MIPRLILKRLILAQIFTLLAVLSIPFLIKILPGLGGKVLYGILAAASIALAVLLRRSLGEIDSLK